nr:hypothetical protein [uncultured Acinetobacter sp.]
MDFTFIEKLKFVLDLITNKQNRKSGEDVYSRFRSFLIDIKEIDSNQVFESDEKKVLKNLRVCALTGARDANYEEFIIFKTLFTTDKLPENYWSFARNRAAFTLDLKNNNLEIDKSGMYKINAAIVLVLSIFIFLFAFVAMMFFQQIINIKGELTLSLTIVLISVGFLLAFLAVTTLRLFYDHLCFTSLCAQVKQLSKTQKDEVEL